MSEQLFRVYPVCRLKAAGVDPAPTGDAALG